MTLNLTWYFPGWVALWVRHGGRDRDTGELEGVLLAAGRLGEHQHAGRGSVTGAELVTPDGDLVRASPGHEPDLLWAVREGGGAGVVIALGAVNLAVPRDRKGSFEPQIVRRGQGPGRTRQPQLTSAPATGSHPRCLLAAVARAPGTETGAKYRLQRPLLAAGPRPRDREPHRWCGDQPPR